jgi:hypothetical protein
MADASLQIGNGNWAVKTSLLLGYNIVSNRYNPIEIGVTRETTGSRTNQAGIIDYKDNNIARINYEGGVGSLLLEPQRTNLVLQSEAFDNIYWLKTALITADSTISPSGIQNADTFTDSSSASYLDVRTPAITITANATYSSSFFIKKTIGALTNYAGVGFILSGVLQRIDFGIINTTTGQVVRDSSSNINAITYSTQSYGNYWRIVATFTDNQSNSLCQIYLYPAISTNGINISSSAQGSNVFWGAQFEQGAYPTSYIPTTTTALTRNADVCSKSGISDLIGQTEGTMYLDFAIGTSVNFESDIRISSPQNNVAFYNVGLRPTIGVQSANITTVNTGLALDNMVIGVSNKIAIAYKNNDFAVYQNGVLKFTQNSGNVPISLTDLTLSNGARFNSIKGVMLFKTRLTNSELAQLTTL